MANARRINLAIQYDGTDISSSVASFLESCTISDVMGGSADSVDITLQDKNELWQGDWLPDRGALLTIALIQENWHGMSDAQTLPIGKFELDEVECSMAPHEVKIKAVSVPNNSNLRGVEKTRSWEKTKLSVIAKDITTGAGMELYYDTQEDPQLDRAEQSEQTDLEFLLKLCNDAGLALKVTDGKIAIFDEEKFEKADPVRTITNGESALLSWSLKASIHNIYKACHVKYKHNKKSELIEYTFTDPNKKKGMTLEVHDKVENVAEAEKLAKKKLREKNREETTVTMSMIGDFDLLASNTVQLAGFHKFDGKYIIVKATHSIGSAYTVSMDLRKCIDGY